MTSATTETGVDPAIYEVPRRIVEAWAAQDAEAFAAVFTPDATMILPGDVNVQGREGVAGYMAGAYQGPLKGTRVSGNPIGLHFLSESVCVLITEGGVLQPGETETAPERLIRATWVLSRTGDEWLIGAYHNSNVNI